MLERQVKTDLRRSRLREAFWIAIFAAQVVVLLVGYFR